jgi:hypothetical protein
LEGLQKARRSLADEVEPDIAPMRGLTPEQRGDLFAAVCHAAWAMLRSRPDFPAAAEYADPLPADFEAKWSALVERRRVQRRADRGSG